MIIQFSKGDCLENARLTREKEREVYEKTVEIINTVTYGNKDEIHQVFDEVQRLIVSDSWRGWKEFPKKWPDKFGRYVVAFPDSSGKFIYRVALWQIVDKELSEDEYVPKQQLVLNFESKEYLRLPEPFWFRYIGEPEIGG